VIVIQFTLLVALQLQVLAEAVTLTLLLAGEEVKELPEEERLKPQAPSWVTVKGCPAIVNVPVRLLVLGLAWTE